MQDPASLTVERLDDLVLVRLEGEVDMGNADRLGQRVVSGVLDGDDHASGGVLANRPRRRHVARPDREPSSSVGLETAGGPRR